MRNINKIGMTIIGLLIGDPIFAYVYEDATESNLIHCPDKVECVASGIAKDGGVVSNSFCKPDDDKRGYIDRMVHYGKYGNYTGTYNFQIAYANYNESPYSIVSEVLCRYKLADSWIDVTYRAIANLEVYYNKPTKWKIGKKINYKQNSTCKAFTSSECPLRSKPEIVIDSRVANDKFLTVNVSANGIGINQGFLTSNLNQYLRINYDEAYVACGGVTQCKIDIYYNQKNTPKMYYAGNIVVDMSDNMKILQVNTDLSNGGSGTYLLKKWSQFNAVQFVN